MSVLDRVATLDKLFVQQKFTAFVNRYRISTVADEGDSEGEPLVYVQQKRLAIREQIEFYADEQQTQPVLRLKKRNVMEFHGRTDVLLPDGTLVGQLQKVFGKSLFVSTWELLDAAGNTVAVAKENSLVVAMVRRLWGFIPVLNNVPCFIPFHFDITIDGAVVGKYTRIVSLLDRYVLDLTGDTQRRIDRRVALAFTIALDALQDR